MRSRDIANIQYKDHLRSCPLFLLDNKRRNGTCQQYRTNTYICFHPLGGVVAARSRSAIWLSDARVGSRRKAKTHNTVHSIRLRAMLPTAIISGDVTRAIHASYHSCIQLFTPSLCLRGGWCEGMPRRCRGSIPTCSSSRDREHFIVIVYYVAYHSVCQSEQLKILWCTTSENDCETLTSVCCYCFYCNKMCNEYSRYWWYRKFARVLFGRYFYYLFQMYVIKDCIDNALVFCNIVYTYIVMNW